MLCTAMGVVVDLFDPPNGLTPVLGVCQTVPDQPLYENKGVATGTPEIGDPVQDEDPSHYCVPPGPKIDIEKFTEGLGADDPNGGNADGDAPRLDVGDPVTWTYVVTNTGNVTLSPVSVVDDSGTPADTTDDLSTALGTISCPLTSLAPGASMLCTAMGVVVDLFDPPNGLTPVLGVCQTVPDQPLYENKGVATGTPEIGDPVQDEDPSHYCVPPGPKIDIEKFTEGLGADDPNGGNADGDAPRLDVGDPVTWTYVVTNTGNVTLSPVSVVDDSGTPADTTDDLSTALGTITCPQTSLAPDESMLCIWVFLFLPWLCLLCLLF